jgi:CheY-like chemotaxis protein
MSVLYVDDDKDDLEIFQLALASTDPTITYTTASSGMEALKSVDENCPEFIFVDYNMPKMNGFETLKALRAKECFNNTKVVIYSTHMDATEMKKCRDLGAYACWVKPRNFRTICEGLRRMLHM